MTNTDRELIQRINDGDLDAFRQLYKRYYAFLCITAEHITKNKLDAEEIVHDVFVSLWEQRKAFSINTSLKAYLVVAVKNRSITQLRRQKNINDHVDKNIDQTELEMVLWDDDYPLGRLFEKEITDIITTEIENLPENCRRIFLLSRKNDLTYKEIAAKLNISINTVKTQMKIALERLRNSLKHYLNVLVIWIWVSSSVILYIPVC